MDCYDPVFFTSTVSGLGLYSPSLAKITLHNLKPTYTRDAFISFHFTNVFTVAAVYC